MRRVLVAAALLAGACAPSAPSDLAGRWQVQQIAGASLGAGVDIWIDIDVRAGAMTGFTGCNNFTAAIASFSNTLAVGPISEEPGECADQAAATDEARFLAVLPRVRRSIRHGKSLELLDANQGVDALLRLRLSEEVGG